MTAPKDQPAGLTVEEWDGRIGEMLGRYEAEEAELKALDAERRGLALRVVAAEPEALARLAAINARGLELRASLDMLRMGIESAGEARRRAASLVTDAEERTRQRSARKLAKELLAASVAADTAMRELAAVLARRKALAQRLQGFGVRANRLILPEAATRAARFHGLHGFLNLPPAPVAHCLPLSAADRPVLPLAGSDAGDEAEAQERAA